MLDNPLGFFLMVEEDRRQTIPIKRPADYPRGTAISTQVAVALKFQSATRAKH